MKQGRSKGITLFELILSFVIGLVVLAGLVKAGKTLLVMSRDTGEEDALTSYHQMIYDLKYNLVLAKNVTIEAGGRGVEILRLDDCTVSFNYDPDHKAVGKRVSCADPDLTAKERSYLVGRVESATFDFKEDSNKLCLTLRFEFEGFRHTVCLSGN